LVTNVHDLVGSLDMRDIVIVFLKSSIDFHVFFVVKGSRKISSAPGAEQQGGAMAESLQQLARNQALFREVNERLGELAEASVDRQAEFVCECSRADCATSIALDRDEYETVRSSPTLFVIAPGHETPGEAVVEENDRFGLVEKTNHPQIEIAVSTDPRSRTS
jgi:hypothetical protein